MNVVVAICAILMIVIPFLAVYWQPKSKTYDEMNHEYHAKIKQNIREGKDPYEGT